MTQLTTSFDIQLVAEIEKQSIIYIPEHPDFRNSKKRHEVWELIGQKLDTNPLALRRRFSWMKEHYRKSEDGKRRVPPKITPFSSLPYYSALHNLLSQGPVSSEKDMNSTSTTSTPDDTLSSSTARSSTFAPQQIEENTFEEATTNEDVEVTDDQLIDAKEEVCDLTADMEQVDRKSLDMVSVQTNEVQDRPAMSYRLTTRDIASINQSSCVGSELNYEVSTTQPAQQLKRHHTSMCPNSAGEDDECMIAGKRIGLQLKNVEDVQLIIAEKLISDVIYNAKMGNLTGKSFIGLQ